MRDIAALISLIFAAQLNRRGWIVILAGLLLCANLIVVSAN